MSLTSNISMIRLTDTRGALLLAGKAYAEPFPGSVVLSSGEYGTAWQRYFSDGLWHRVGGGRAKTWEDMLRKRNLVLVYDAPYRQDGGES
jgi:hypothetical protein